MSGIKDPFEILADEITLIRRQIDNLQRTSLDKKEAEHLNAVVANSLDRLAKIGPRLETVIDARLQLATAETRLAAVEAAQGAAREAIEKSHTENLKAAQSLSQAAGAARREAWRYFGGFWVWLASIGAAGLLMGAMTVFWLQGRADAKAFGQYPGVYCSSAGGQVVLQDDGSKFCAFWIDKPKAEE